MCSQIIMKGEVQVTTPGHEKHATGNRPVGIRVTELGRVWAAQKLLAQQIQLIWVAFNVKQRKLLAICHGDKWLVSWSWRIWCRGPGSTACACWQIWADVGLWPKGRVVAPSLWASWGTKIWTQAAESIESWAKFTFSFTSDFILLFTKSNPDSNKLWFCCKLMWNSRTVNVGRWH